MGYKNLGSKQPITRSCHAAMHRRFWSLVVRSRSPWIPRWRLLELSIMRCVSASLSVCLSICSVFTRTHGPHIRASPRPVQPSGPFFTHVARYTCRCSLVMVSHLHFLIVTFFLFSRKAPAARVLLLAGDENCVPENTRS